MHAVLLFFQFSILHFVLFLKIFFMGIHGAAQKWLYSDIVLDLALQNVHNNSQTR
jgi:hypothetical protein